jgi:hypothetical protein
LLPISKAATDGCVCDNSVYACLANLAREHGFDLCDQALSGGLTGPSDINTGLNFLTKANVDPFLHSQSRYQGNSSAEKELERSGGIAS